MVFLIIIPKNGYNRTKVIKKCKKSKDSLVFALAFFYLFITQRTITKLIGKAMV